MNMFFKMISDLSLEYRTVYARLTQRKERRKRKTGGLISFVSGRSNHGVFFTFSFITTLVVWMLSVLFISISVTMLPPQAKNLQKGPSKTPKKDSESKQTPKQSQGKEVRPPSSGGGDLLETLAMTAINSKDERSKSGWRYRRKAQEKRHQKRKSSEYISFLKEVPG